MNNLVEISYSKSEKYPEIFINGEMISRYMELSEYIYDDVYNWAARMYESVDDELSEDYRISLIGHPFHYEVLSALKERSSYCTEICFLPLEYKIPVSEKFSYALKLNSMLRSEQAPPADCVVFGCDDPERFSTSFPEARFQKEESDYAISLEGQIPENCGKLCVLIGSKIAIERKQGVSYLSIPEEKLSLLIDYLNTYHIRLDFINSVFSAACERGLDPVARLEFDACSKEEYRVWYSALPEKMNSGESYFPEIRVFPAFFEDPAITIVSNDPSVAEYKNGCIVAGEQGECTLRICDKFGNEYHSARLVVERHRYVSNISIILPAVTMKLDETMRFKCIISPADAEDLDSVVYTVSDESVVALSGKNELYALGAGRACVTVSTPRISRSFYITVYPSAYDVDLPAQSIEVPLYAQADIPYAVVPANAQPMPSAIWTTSNKKVAKIVRVTATECKIETCNFGKTVLTCKLEGTDISRSLTIVVPKTKGCYVATAVYGSYDCPQVWALRRYRDEYLDARWYGRAFIKIYYALSPTAVSLFGKSKWFNRLWRGVLDRKVKSLLKKGYKDTPYND